MAKVEARQRWKRVRKSQGDDPDRLRQRVDEVKDVMGALDKLDKALLLYPPGSSMIEGFVDTFTNKVTALLKKSQTIDLTCGPDEIEYEQEPVYDGSGSDRSLTAALDEGGVRRLIFRDGVTKAQIGLFTESLRKSREDEAEDLVTLLWQCGLEHIGYVSVSVFNELDEAIEEANLETIQEKLVERFKERAFRLEEISSIEGSKRGGVETEEEELEIYALTEVEKQDLQGRLTAVAKDSTPKRLAAIVLQLLELDTADDAVDSRVEIFEAALRDLIDDGNVSAAARLLETAKQSAESPERATGAGDVRKARAAGRAKESRAGLVKKFVDVAAGKEIARALTRNLKSKRADIGGVVRYVAGCGKAAFQLGTELLGASAIHDEQILAAIADLVRDDQRQLKKHAADNDPKVALAALRLLAKLLGPAALDEYIAATAHKDATVRRQAIVSLTRCREARAYEKLFQVFNDPQPDIRSMALKAFGGAIKDPDPDQYGRVLAVIEDAHFHERPQLEREALFTILCKLDPDRGFPYLEKVINRFTLMNRERTHRERLVAVAALGEVLHPLSMELLTKVGESTKLEDVRAACFVALERMQQHLQERKERRTKTQTGLRPVSGERPALKKTGERPALKKTGERPALKKTGERPVARPTGERPVMRPTGERPAMTPAEDAPPADKSGGFGGVKIRRVTPDEAPAAKPAAKPPTQRPRPEQEE